MSQHLVLSLPRIVEVCYHSREGTNPAVNGVVMVAQLKWMIKQFNDLQAIINQSEHSPKLLALRLPFVCIPKREKTQTSRSWGCLYMFHVFNQF